MSLYHQAPPFFPGDDWHELRDRQVLRYKGTLRGFALKIENLYMGCWVVAGQPLDTVRAAFREDPSNDLRPLRAMHDLFAAYWRKSNNFTQPPLPGVQPDLEDLVDQWQWWFYDQPQHWLVLAPGVLRTLAELVSGWRADVAGDVIRSWDLQRALGELYDFGILAGDRDG